MLRVTRSIYPTVSGSMDGVDFFAILPPEIVSNIFSYLGSEDAVHCLAVSRLWRVIVLSQDIFWKKACVQFGLPDYIIEEHLLLEKCCTSPAALYLAARRQRQHISGGRGVLSRLERKEGEYPENSARRTSTESMGNGYIRERVYNHHPEGKLVLLGRINDRAIERVCEVPPEVHHGNWRNVLPQQQCVITVLTSATEHYYGPNTIKWLKHAITVSYTHLTLPTIYSV